MTLLRPGCSLVVAPRFHAEVDWASRLAIGGPAWRAPSEEELRLLVGDPAQISRDRALAECLCLWGLPRHLLALWQAVLEATEERPAALAEGLDAYTAEVAAFLAFKGMPVSEGARMDLLASRPGLAAIEWPSRPSRPWGGVNLGDEPFSLVFVNQISTHEAGPDNPAVRLRIDPGEGFRLPNEGLAIEVSTTQAEGPTLFLAIGEA